MPDQSPVQQNEIERIRQNTTSAPKVFPCCSEPLPPIKVISEKNITNLPCLQILATVSKPTMV